jgi:hypothetical protein
VSGRAALVAAVLGLLAPPKTPGKPPRAEEPPRRVEPKRMKVTQGAMEPLSDGRLLIEAPKVRAVLSTPETPRPQAAMTSERARVAELRFTYLGATREQVPLRSGEMRRQVGLKLRAQDGCNVVYVMWRLEPKAGLVVSVKHNPGMHRSDDCGNGGYETVRPSRKSPVPELAPGEGHTLRAEFQGAKLMVKVDDQPVWEGTLPAEALTFDGPVGLRTDNGRFQVELLSTP